MSKIHVSSGDYLNRILRSRFELISATLWEEYLKNNLPETFKLKDIYDLYFSFHEKYEEEIFIEMKEIIEESSMRINSIITAPRMFKKKEIK